jgi:hypothetical protein
MTSTHKTCRPTTRKTRFERSPPVKWWCVGTERRVCSHMSIGVGELHSVPTLALLASAAV